MKNDLTSPIRALHRVRAPASLPGRALHGMGMFAKTRLLASLALSPALFAAYTDGPVLEFLDFDNFNPPAWTQVSGAAPIRGSAADPFMELANGVAKSDITPGLYDPAYDTFASDEPVTNNWTLRFDARHSDRRRALWAGLFNAAGTQGYAILWDSAASGTGQVSIRKFDLANEVGWSDSGTVLGSPISSGHDPLSSTPARLELSWDASSRTLYVRVDGVPRSSVVDTSFDSFSRIYVRGNTTSYFANISVLSETPPSATEIAAAYNLVTDGGAVGDGTTNDRAAILAAIAAAQTAGQALYVPPGVYAISDYINAQNIDIFGHGYVSAFRALNPDRRSVKFTGDGGSLTKLRLISATTSRNTGPASAGVSFVGATNFLLGHVFIEGANSAGVIAHTTASSAGEIAENWISDTLANGIILTAGSHHTTIAHNRLRNTGDHAVAVQTLPGQSLCHDVTITRNDIETPNVFGVDLADSELIIIDHNWILANRGIDITGVPWEFAPSQDVSIIGNIVVGIDLEAIAVGGVPAFSVNNPTIQDNQLYALSPSADVMKMYTISGAVVSGNRFEGGANGLIFGGRDSADVTISNNDFVGNSRASIELYEDGYRGEGLLLINGNRFSELSRHPSAPGPAAVIDLGDFFEPWESTVVTNNTWDEEPAAIDWFLYSEYPLDDVSGNDPSDRNYIGTGGP